MASQGPSAFLLPLRRGYWEHQGWEPVPETSGCTFSALSDAGEGEPPASPLWKPFLMNPKEFSQVSGDTK